MKPFHIVTPPGPEFRQKNPLFYIPFKGVFQRRGTYLLKEEVEISFRLETESELDIGTKHGYVVEVHLSLNGFGTCFLMRKTFIPEEHLLHEICIPTKFIREDKPIEELMLEVFSKYLAEKHGESGVSLTVTATKDKISAEIVIGTYEGSDDLPTDWEITGEALQNLFKITRSSLQ